MKFTITTISTCYTNYDVYADTEEQAKEKFYAGVWKNERITDYANEDIYQVEVAKE